MLILNEFNDRLSKLWKTGGKFVKSNRSGNISSTQTTLRLRAEEMGNDWFHESYCLSLHSEFLPPWIDLLYFHVSFDFRLMCFVCLRIASGPMSRHGFLSSKPKRAVRSNRHFGSIGKRIGGKQSKTLPRNSTFSLLVETYLDVVLFLDFSPKSKEKPNKSHIRTGPILLSPKTQWGRQFQAELCSEAWFCRKHWFLPYWHILV